MSSRVLLFAVTLAAIVFATSAALEGPNVCVRQEV